MSLKSKLESLLFVAVKPLSLKDLTRLSQGKTKEVVAALEELSHDYQERESGLALIVANDQYQITTVADNAELVQAFLKTETSGELTQASLEALTIIAYRGPVSKLELERIRGINCSLIIRNLLIRGLIEERWDKSKAEHYYSVTPDFIRFLGIKSVNELSDYEKLNKLETIDQVLQERETASVE